MLRSTFCHIPGIGMKKEKYLWERGILSWDKYVPLNNPLFSRTNKLMLEEYISNSIKCLNELNIDFFTEKLPDNQCWRVFPDFRDSIAYIDIETTGLDPEYNQITTIALYDGNSIYYYIYKTNLNDFVKDIKRYKIIITYNGKCFDLPFLQKYFNINLNHYHIDLRYVLWRLGYSGGLKGCERQLGINRKELEGVNGYFAVLLWNEYVKKSDTKALETLLAYNIEDVVNLEKLLVFAYNENLKNTPFYDSYKIESPIEPNRPFKPNKRTIRKIRSRYYF